MEVEILQINCQQLYLPLNIQILIPIPLTYSFFIILSWKDSNDWCSTHSDSNCALRVFPGAGDATNARLQRRPNADAHNGTVYGGPSSVAMETAGHGHDGQVSAAVGWAG